MLSTAGVPEVPPVPSGQTWGRETGQWVPISESGGTFLPIAGGSMQGNINMSGNSITNMAAVPAMPNGAAPAQWVLNQIASVSLYQGTWDADTNVPDLTQLSTHVNAYTWIALTTSPSGVVIGPAIPGLQGTTVFNGDTIIYSTTQGGFTAIHSGGITLPEADGRYVQLAGSQMSGALLLNANATQPLQAATFGQLESALANTVTPDAPADGQAYLRVGVGAPAARWVPGLPLAGGILTGALTLSGNATQNLNAVPLQQVNSLITAGTTGFLPLAGGQMTGLMQLSGNASVNLNPVPLQQLNAMLASYATTAMLANYAPIASPTFTGTVTIPAGALITGYALLASPTFTGTVTIPTLGGGATANRNFNIQGVIDASNAPAGDVGEFVTGSGGPSGASTNTWASTGSVSLTAGDWDVWGILMFSNSGGTMTVCASGISTALNVGPNLGTATNFTIPGMTTLNQVVMPVRVNISTTTTVYINGYSSFTGTCNFSYQIM